jgi:hypothetical protein
MALRETMNQMNHLLAAITKDLAKAGNGNKTAAQRVRIGSIKLGKIAKIFRKESVAAEKSGQLKKKPRIHKKPGKKSQKRR